MQNSDIIETCGCLMEEKIGGEWKHEVAMYGMSSCHLNFMIDGKEYVLVLHEIKDGEHFDKYLEGE